MNTDERIDGTLRQLCALQFAILRIWRRQDAVKTDPNMAFEAKQCLLRDHAKMEKRFQSSYDRQVKRLTELRLERNTKRYEIARLVQRYVAA